MGGDGRNDVVGRNAGFPKIAAGTIGAKEFLHDRRIGYFPEVGVVPVERSGWIVLQQNRGTRVDLAFGQIECKAERKKFPATGANGEVSRSIGTDDVVWGKGVRQGGLQT